MESWARAEQVWWHATGGVRMVLMACCGEVTSMILPAETRPDADPRRRLKDVNRTVRLPAREERGADRRRTSRRYRDGPQGQSLRRHSIALRHVRPGGFRDREPERFGMEIFRNGTRELDAIPMDLPVGRTTW